MQLLTGWPAVAASQLGPLVLVLENAVALGGPHHLGLSQTVADLEVEGEPGVTVDGALAEVALLLCLGTLVDASYVLPSNEFVLENMIL